MILLTTTILFAILSQAIMVANAQDEVATVVIQPSVGGTTDPVSGTYTYVNGTEFVLTATPDTGYTFQYWVVSGDYTPGHDGPTQVTYIIDEETGEVIGSIPRPGSTGVDSLVFTNNPANISHGYGYTFVYQAVFAPITEPTPAPEPTPATPTNDTAIVIIEPSIGGTTNPAAGTYAYPNGTNFVLTATPNAGYTFQYWIVNGNTTAGHLPGQVSVITDDEGNVIASIPRPNTNSSIDSLTFTANPANISHGYGYTYAYSAVFAPIVVTPSPPPTVTASPTPTISPSPTPAPAAGLSTEWIIAIVVVVIIIIAAIAAFAMRRKK